MTVPKITSNNFEDFGLDFQGADRRQVGLYGIPLAYLLCPNDSGYYDVVCNSREEKLNNCVIFVGQYYKDDSEILYILLVQHVGTSGPGSNIIANHMNSKDGRRFYLYLKGNFLTESYDQTKYQRAEKKISESTYSGGKRNCKIEDYYNIMSKEFNDLDKSGGVYALPEEHKINKFECGMKEAVAIAYYIHARKEWDTIQGIKSFYIYFNIFYVSLSKHNTLISPYNNHQYPRIDGVDTIVSGIRGRGRGRGRGIWRERGRGRGGKCGHGCGKRRGRVKYNPYSLARKYGYFVAEARVYPKYKWMALSHYQHESVTRKKTAAGWLDGGTPPSGFNLNDQGHAFIITSLVSAIKENISNSIFNSTSGLFSLPPLLGNTPHIPPMVITKANSYGKSFVRRGTRQHPKNDSSSIYSVRINGRPYQGLIFDTNGQRINCPNRIDVASDNALDSLNYPHAFEIFQQYF